MITKMHTQTALPQIRLDNIKTCLNAAMTTLDVVSKNLKTPFLEPIVNTTRSLLSVVEVISWSSGSWEMTNSTQRIKKNKDVCAEMLEQIHKLLYAIIHVHLTSNTGGKLTPKMLDNLGQFTQ
jgi:hypothetical protein